MNPKPPSRKDLLQQELFDHATRFEYYVFKYRGWLALASFAVCFLLVIIFGNLIPKPDWKIRFPQSSGLQEAHAIGLAMYSYANEHNGNYPSGNSSTEVFQQLLDQGYVTDPAIFFISNTPGKIEATSKKLKPENVSWDVTDGARTDDSPDLPLVFSTGCKIDYVPNAKAHPPAKSPFGDNGIAVYYVGNWSQFAVRQPGGVPILSPNFDPKGKTYRQLTPDGMPLR